MPSHPNLGLRSDARPVRSVDLPHPGVAPFTGCTHSLAVVPDLFPRKEVAWRFPNSLETVGLLAALEQALTPRRPATTISPFAEGVYNQPRLSPAQIGLACRSPGFWF